MSKIVENARFGDRETKKIVSAFLFGFTYNNDGTWSVKTLLDNRQWHDIRKVLGYVGVEYPSREALTLLLHVTHSLKQGIIDRETLLDGDRLKTAIVPMTMLWDRRYQDFIEGYLVENGNDWRVVREVLTKVSSRPIIAESTLRYWASQHPWLRYSRRRLYSQGEMLEWKKLARKYR